jgi:hypothetical protein
VTFNFIADARVAEAQNLRTLVVDSEHRNRNGGDAST